MAITGCTSQTPKQSTTPETQAPASIEEIRIVAKRSQSGDYSLTSYDAAQLFERGLDLMAKHEYPAAIGTFDRLTVEFPSSRFVSSSFYNAGLCLAYSGNLAQATQRFENLLRAWPNSPDAEDASFQLATLYYRLQKWPELQRTTTKALLRRELSTEERVEMMARKAQALLGLTKVDAAKAQAQETLQYVRTRKGQDVVRDEFFAAAANFVLAETIRIQGETLVFPQAEIEEQRKILTRKAEFLLDAQREYFNTIRWTNAHWAAAAGYEIGAMYDRLWHSVITAPVPPHLHPEGHKIYRDKLANMLRPLLRHAIRYWELTLLMVERTGVKTDWTERIRADLERTRQLLIEQTTPRTRPNTLSHDEKP